MRSLNSLLVSISDSEKRNNWFMADDTWSPKGPSEENTTAVSQCGMSTADVTAMTSAWADNMAAVQTAIIKAGGFNEQLMHGEYHVHQAQPVPPCATFLRDACKPNASATTSAMMYGFTQVSESPHTPFLPNGSLPAFEQDLATFLLVPTIMIALQGSSSFISSL